MKFRLVAVLGIILFCFLNGESQVCSGNLGENIFLGGDFGSGSANILYPDPHIAPGYNYAQSVPPFDGSYVITNNTSWPGMFPTWLGIKDNSNDPNGYMMVVNASFTPGIFYEQTITGLCENTLYEFSADVINMIRIPVTNHILPNVSFLLNGVIKYNTGAIPQSEKWNKVGFTFTSQPGQDTVTLSLQNNAPGGNGNDLALDNISFRACGPQALILPETIANICEDGSPINLKATIIGKQYANQAIQWQRSPDGKNDWTNILGDSVTKHSDLFTGFYYYRYLIASSPQNLTNPKCRIVSNIKIIRVVPKFYTISDTICAGLNYIIGKKAHSTSGVYIDSLKSSLGCDSIVTLNLTVLPDRGIAADKTVQSLSCSDGNDAFIKLGGIRNGIGPYSIKLNTQSLPVDSTFKNLTKGKYTLNITDHIGCVLKESLNISSPDPFSIELGEDRNLILGERINLSVQANYIISSSKYLLGLDVVCDHACEGKSWIPFESGLLIVQATSSKGCVAKDTIRLSVKEVVKAFIPNIFTPNSDGTNDYFTILGDEGNIKIIQLLQIFNRWGGLVFEGKDLLPNDLQSGWDGNVLGKPAEEGNYVYLAKVQLLNDKIKRLSGDILLNR
ncbi:MAG: gliding motility-associated C-terminal domain-containing protein [Saprospiraceae bacterium]